MKEVNPHDAPCGYEAIPAQTAESGNSCTGCAFYWDPPAPMPDQCVKGRCMDEQRDDGRMVIFVKVTT